MQELSNGQHVGHNIKKYRSLKGMKQHELADKIGVTRSMVSYFERTGKILPHQIKAIAAVFGITSGVLGDTIQLKAPISMQGNAAQTITVQNEIIEQLKSEIAGLKDTIRKQWELLSILAHRQAIQS